MSEKLTVAELLARNGRGDSTHSATPRRRRRTLAEGGISVAELTGSIPVVTDKQLEKKAEEKPEPKPAPKPAPEEKPLPPKPQPKPEPELPVAVPKEFQKDERLAELQAELEEGEILEFEDNRISLPAMLLQAGGGIVGGMALFLVFGWLWETLPTIAVLGLALVVTLVLVGLTHVMLRHKDLLLMILAFFVGLVLTVGPRIIMGI